MYNIYILAGGKSSRMGSEKGLVKLKNKPLIQYVIDVALKISPHIFILSSNKDYETFGFPMIEDQVSGLGPAGAINTLLSHTDKELNIVLACDMPYIDADSIRFLLNACKGYEIAIPVHQSFIEAMPGIYSRHCKQKWNESIEQNLRKLSDIISLNTVNFVSADELLLSNEKLFKNMNAKHDLY